jgi:NADPH:quinone reductase-like Zn-dependent oxidoreductase
MAKKMKAAIFVEKGRIVLDDKPIPDIGPNDALMRVTTTTICGTDVHILKGEYPVAKGLTIGHEPVGIIEKLGSSVLGFKEGQRVSPAQLRRRVGAMLVSAVAARRMARGRNMAGRPSAAGSSVIRSTAARPNMFECPTRWPTWHRSMTGCPTNRC